MTFTTLTFLIFLILVFTVYWSIRNRRYQNMLLIAASYFFYGWWDWRFCSLMLISSLVDFFVGLGLERTDRPRRRKALVAVSILCNLGMLGFFKYFNFFAENFALLANVVGWHVSSVTLRIVLPVGISFYTFQTMSYTLDVYRRQMRATHRLIDYMAYVSFFPQLVAGPIERATRLLPQFFAERTFDYDKSRDGARQMLWGVFKKLALADNLAVVVDQCYADPSAMGGPAMAVGTFCFALQIYCDFSAYSDIAIGTARVFGFRLMRNFAYPYFSQDLAEFWRRWHISLSTWFRDYVYIPLGGSRVSTSRRCVNVVATFVISGLWHGASWNFVIWGAVNGVGSLPAILRRSRSKRAPSIDCPGGERFIPRPGVLGRMILTFLISCLAWVFFRARTLGRAWTVLAAMATDLFNAEAYVRMYQTLIVGGRARILLVLLPAFVLVEWIQRRHRHPLVFGRLPRPLRWAIYTALLWVAILLEPRQTGQFIYFQF